MERTMVTCIISLPKGRDKEQIFKRAAGEGESCYTHKNKEIRMTANLTLKTMQVRRQ